jgi:4-alpha-glucanotransferase
MMSVSHTAIFPLQDVLGFGADTRMNLPGRPYGNWAWRFTIDWLEKPEINERLAKLTKIYARWPETPDEDDEQVEK